MTAVTVFTPVYNGLPHLREAIDSIRRQTLEDWVFLVVDDGSTDGSADYVESLGDPRIRVLRQAHQGPAVASNWALELCQTEFFARMDADDVAYPTRLEEQLAFLNGHPEVGLLGTQVEPLGSLRAGRPSSLATDHATIFNDLMHGRHAMCNPTVMCRTALLREVGAYQPDGALEDWSMFLRMGERAQLANLDRVLLSYRIHTGSTNGRHMAELRARIAFVCDHARRRQAGTPPISYEDFCDARRRGPFWRRLAQAAEGYAMAQYRLAMADILGPRRAYGYARLAYAACCSPTLTVQRVARVARKRLPMSRRHSGAIVPETDAVTPSTKEPSVKWPRKYDLFGVQVSATSVDEAAGLILQAARENVPAVVSFQAVHAVVTTGADPALREAVNSFELVGPDGQPVRWALNLLHGVGLRERVYGPELMLRLCQRAAAEAVPLYLYGSSPGVIASLSANLLAKYPSLAIAGAESPPFRALSAAEEQETAERIEASGARIVFVGLGAPKQDQFAARLRGRVRAVQVCVGAAFDFHAGTKRMAPRWMQRSGLEWLFRLCAEPRRLWRRYLVTNSVFLGKLAVALLQRPLRAPAAARASEPASVAPQPRRR